MLTTETHFHSSLFLCLANPTLTWNVPDFPCLGTCLQLGILSQSSEHWINKDWCWSDLLPPFWSLHVPQVNMCSFLPAFLKSSVFIQSQFLCETSQSFPVNSAKSQTSYICLGFLFLGEYSLFPSRQSLILVVHFVTVSSSSFFLYVNVWTWMDPTHWKLTLCVFIFHSVWNVPKMHASHKNREMNILCLPHALSW